jgi:hypothetical protein
MVDLLAGDHHVYKSPSGAEKLCTSLRNSKSIYAYHLWSDRMGGAVKVRNRDIANVQTWDPTHATYVGDYNASEISGLSNPDLVGYYDCHWKRGGHWRDLLRSREVPRISDSFFLKHADDAPGKIGVGNYNRVLYPISMSVACRTELGYYTPDEPFRQKGYAPESAVAMMRGRTGVGHEGGIRWLARAHHLLMQGNTRAAYPNRLGLRNSIGCRVVPSLAKSASTSPITLENLKPCPLNPAAKVRFSRLGCGPMMK